MNHDKLPANSPESRADNDALTALHKRIGAFVQAFGPGEAALASIDTTESSTFSPCVYLTFPRTFLEEIAPEPVQRLQIEDLSLFQDIHADTATSGLDSGVFIDKSPDAMFASTIYKQAFKDTFLRESDPRPGNPWPLPSQDPSRASVQECSDMNAILDALLQLDKEVVASVMQTEVA